MNRESVEALVESGYTNVGHLTSGMNGWTEAGRIHTAPGEHHRIADRLDQRDAHGKRRAAERFKLLRDIGSIAIAVLIRQRRVPAQIGERKGLFHVGSGRPCKPPPARAQAQAAGSSQP